MYNIIAFLGPSGTGKSTLQKQLGIKSVVTWTSRKIRQGEIHGKDYFFTEKEEIIKMYKEGKLLEYAEYNGNLYGIGTEYIDELILSNKQGSIVVEANGAKVLKNKYPTNVLVIGVLVPYSECEARLTKRKDNEIDKRLNTYNKEVSDVLEISDIIINNTSENWDKTNKLLNFVKDS